MPTTKVELNIAEQAIAEVITDRLKETIACPSDWDADDYASWLKLLSKQDGVKRLAIDFLTRQEEYPIDTMSQDFPFTNRVVKRSWRIIDWAKVEQKVAGVVDKFKKVAATEIAKSE